MPRKRPGAIRATRQEPVRYWARAGGPLDRLSPAVAGVLWAVENGVCFSGQTRGTGGYDPDPFDEHVRPGLTVYFLREYRDFLRRPGRRLRLEASVCPSCPGCMYQDIAVVRDALEAVTRRLPPAARVEMRRLLSRLDDDFRRRTIPDSSPRTSWRGEPLPWWHRLIYIH